MSAERRYLSQILLLAKSRPPSGLRTALQMIVAFALVSGSLILLPLYFGLLEYRDAYFLGGFVLGAIAMRLSTTYRFRYAAPHLDTESVRARIDELETEAHR